MFNIHPPRLAELHWIGTRSFQESVSLLASRGISPAVLQQLRRHIPASHVRLAADVAAALPLIAEKFPSFPQWLATKRAAEQATDERLAAWKASRFPPDAHVVDGCSGMGGDALAIATRTAHVLCVDRDPVLAKFCQLNTRNAGRTNVTQVVADCEDLVIPSHACWHIDPDRRVYGRRSASIEKMSPGLTWIESLRARAPHGALKLSPASDIPKSWEGNVERCWVSTRGECRQQVVWWGDLANARGRRIAVQLREASPPLEFERTQWETTLPLAKEVSAFVAEINPALLAADAGLSFAEHHQLTPLTPRGAYVTADTIAKSIRPWLQVFQVQAVLPFRYKKILNWCRSNQSTITEVKQRSTGANPNEWLVRLRKVTQGGAPVTMIVTRLSNKLVAILATRCTPES